MQILSHTWLAYYIAVMVVLCVYGVHRYRLVWLFHRGGRAGGSPPRRFTERPRVTIQLPMFNEPKVAERVIEAACAMDYPRDRLQVQVLDDSTDECAAIARRCCARLAESGHDVDYRHRTDRLGYKAGALAAGLAGATGEFVAIFDADFVPPPDFLRRTIDEFTDEQVGLVQGRWAYLNGDDSMLTRIQAMSLDAHFLIEQQVRAGTGRWFNFNGTAGIWRRRCIDDAGGWRHETLTEDTDLSYRAQMAGWRFLFRPDVVCPSEIPPTMTALMSQQHRWSKGLIQNAIKLMPGIMRSGAPLRTRMEAWFHLTSPLPYVFVLLLGVLVMPALFFGMSPDGVTTAVTLGLGLACLGLGTAGAAVFYVEAQRAAGRSLLRAVLYLPALMAVGIGISVINTRAVLEALFGHRSAFVRTPKFNGTDDAEPDPVLARQPRRLPRGWLETTLGVLMTISLVTALTSPSTIPGVPFGALFAGGFLAVGLPALRQALAGRMRGAAIGRLATAESKS